MIVSRVRHTPPWLDSKLKDMIKQKRATWKAFKRFRSVDYLSAFRAMRNKVCSTLRTAEKQYLLSLHRDIRTVNRSDSVNTFWSYIKRVTGRIKASTIPDLEVTHPQDGSSDTITTDAGKASTLNSFFVQQTCLHDPPQSFPVLPAASQESPESFSTSPCEVYNILSHLKPGKAPGLDGLPPALLRLCASGISESLSTLFNRSFAEGAVPRAWKEALVVPVYKGGCKSFPSNYRPIALLSIVSKVMEKIVLKRLTAFIDPILSPKQSGFRKKDSTSHQLLRLVQEWSTALDSSHLIGVVFFDFKKAFDRVHLPGLIHKLQAAGLRGQALAWCSHFVTGRYQRVRVGNVLSPPEPLHAGVPQGAILSPLLFSLYVNDIVSSVDEEVNLFADDTSVYVTDKSASSLQRRLQSVIDRLSLWFRSWAVTVNPSKSALMVLTTRRSVPVVSVNLDGSNISQVSTHKHLGVTFNSRLSWSDHVDTIVKKTSCKVGLLRRIRRRVPPLVLRSIYLTCVRPVLEYACGSWSGLSAQDCLRLDRIQRSAARLIAGVSIAERLPHEILLARAGLEPLARRRNVILAAPIYRLSSRDPSGPDHLKAAFSRWCTMTPPSTSAMQLRSTESNCLRLPRPRTEILRRSPFYRAVSLLNSLPPAAKTNWPSLKSVLLSST